MTRDIWFRDGARIGDVVAFVADAPRVQGVGLNRAFALAALVAGNQEYFGVRVQAPNDATPLGASNPTPVDLGGPIKTVKTPGTLHCTKMGGQP